MFKAGGELVYATCSILKEENEDIVQSFLKQYKNFEIQKINLKILKDFVKKEGFVQIDQNEKTDGFFICKMRKK